MLATASTTMMMMNTSTSTSTNASSMMTTTMEPHAQTQSKATATTTTTSVSPVTTSGEHALACVSALEATLADASALSRVLAQAISVLTAAATAGVAVPSKSVFDGQSRVPLDVFTSTSIRLLDYLRVDRTSVLLHIFVYLDRVHRSGALVLSGGNVMRLYLALFLLAIKFVQDKGLSARAYASLIGMDVRDVLELEREALALLQFQLCVDADELFVMQRALLSLA